MAKFCQIWSHCLEYQIQLDLNSLDDERRDHVERHPHQVEERQTDERRFSVENVLGVDQHERRKRRERDEKRRR